MTSDRPTENFRRQHEELMELGLALLNDLRRPDVCARAGEIRRDLARFVGKLSVHARMENEALYPRLLHHPDTLVRETAESFVDELGPIYDDFVRYVRGWLDVVRIAGDSATFVRETREVFRLLAMRMMRETSELYPLADAG